MACSSQYLHLNLLLGVFQALRPSVCCQFLCAGMVVILMILPAHTSTISESLRDQLTVELNSEPTSYESETYSCRSDVSVQYVCAVYQHVLRVHLPGPSGFSVWVPHLL